MGTRKLDTVTTPANTVTRPTDWAGDTVKEAKFGLDRVARPTPRRFMVTGYEKGAAYAVGGDGKNVGIDLAVGR